MNAQTTSVQNGGVSGIYSLVDSSTTFVRRPQDVIAAWTCESMGYNITYAPSYTPVEIAQDLVNRGLMYPIVDQSSYYVGSNTSGLVVVGASTNGSPFQVSLAVDGTPHSYLPKFMSTYICTLSNINGNVDGIVSYMSSSDFVSGWLENMQGGCYDGSLSYPIPNVESFMERVLNTMVMLQCGNNSDQNTLSSPQSQPCIVEATAISPGVFALVAFSGVIALFLFIFWLVQLYTLHDLKARRNAEGVDSLPDGTLGWILQAARESTYNRAQHPEPTSSSPEMDHPEAHKMRPIPPLSPAFTPQADKESGSPSSKLSLPEKPREMVHWACTIGEVSDGQVVKLKKL